MKKISIIHYAGPPIVGGVESTIEHHARLLAAVGYSVDVIAGRGNAFDPAVCFHRVEEIDSRDPQVEAVNQELAQNIVSDSYYALRDRLLARLQQLLAQTDLVIVHNALTLHKNLALTAALHGSKKASQAGWIAWSHDFAWQDPLYTSSLHNGTPWNLLRTPWPGVRYVAVSNHRRVQLSGLLGIPESVIDVIPPGVDAYGFLGIGPLTREIADRLELLKASPLLILPARITRRKNIEYALQVTAALKTVEPDALLVVTGPPGPHNPQNAAYLASLQELRQRLHLERNVVFLYELGADGQPLHLSESDVAELYRLADLLFFPSQREGFGIPVLEAGLARIPVFAADIPPVHESAAGLAQVFSLSADPEEVAGRIAAYLQTDPTYRLRRRVLNEFTWQAVLERHLIPVIEEGINR